MTVRRIISNIATADINAVQAFYSNLFELDMIIR